MFCLNRIPLGSFFNVRAQESAFLRLKEAKHLAYTDESVDVDEVTRESEECYWRQPSAPPLSTAQFQDRATRAAHVAHPKRHEGFGEPDSGSSKNASVIYKEREGDDRVPGGQFVGGSRGPSNVVTQAFDRATVGSMAEATVILVRQCVILKIYL